MSSAAVKCLYDQMVAVEDLKPHPKNPNRHGSDQLDRLGFIIETQGWRRPVRVSKLSGHITAGHGALEAAKKKGWTHVPVNFQEYASEAEEYQDIVADNAIGLWSELDLEMIKMELPALGEMNLELLGLEKFDLSTERTEDGEVFDRTHEQYTGSIIKQIVLFFKADDYPTIVARANAMLERLEVKDYSELFLRLMDEHDRTHAPASGPQGPAQEVSPSV